MSNPSSYESPIRMGGGIAVLDYDRDGWEDYYLTMGMSADEFWRNNGDGTFTNIIGTTGIDTLLTMGSTGVISGDIDNDGYRELFITTDIDRPNLLYYNNGDGSFTEIGIPAGVRDTSRSFSASFGDLDKDGDLDLYVGNYVEVGGFITDSAGTLIGFAHSCGRNWLYMNNGDLTFSEVGIAAMVPDTGCELAIALTDYDNDNDADIFVINDFGEFIVPNALYQNEYPSTGPYTDVSVPTGMDIGMYGMGVAIGDYDHDMDLDYYISNLGDNKLLNNNAGVNFTDTAAFAGVVNGMVDTLLTTGWGTAFIDADNDKWQDLVLSNGHIPAAEFIATGPWDPNKYWANNGDGTFKDISDSVGFNDVNVGRGLAWTDFDHDGDQDVWVMNNQNLIPDSVYPILYRNDLVSDNHWLQVSVEGTVSNRDGFGTHLEAHVGGDSWLYEITCGSSHLSQNSSIAHFGLGADTLMDSLVIHWPSGITETFYDLAADTTYGAIEDSTLTIITHNDPVVELPEIRLHVYPNPFDGDVTLEWLLMDPGPVSIKIYNLFGQLQYSQPELKFVPGNNQFTWNGLDQSGNELAAGIYIVKVQQGTNTLSKKLIKY